MASRVSVYGIPTSSGMASAEGLYFRRLDSMPSETDSIPPQVADSIHGFAVILTKATNPKASAYGKAFTIPQSVMLTARCGSDTLGV